MRRFLVLPSAALVFASAAAAQQPPAASSAKIELKDTPAPGSEPLTPDVKLDPSPAPSLPGAGSVPAPQALPPPEDENQIPFGLEKLSEKDRKEVSRLISQVSTYLGTPRQLEAWEKIDEVEKITGPYHMVENLRGAVMTKQKSMAKARQHFLKAAELAKASPKDSYHPRFNIAELDFVERKWDAARAGFQQVLADHLAFNERIYAEGKAYLDVRDEMFKALDEREQAVKTAVSTGANNTRDLLNIPAVKAAVEKTTELRKKSDALEGRWKYQYRPTRANERLIHFKLMVCDLQQGKTDDAAKHEETFDKYDIDSPAYYFAQAVKVYLKIDKTAEGLEKENLKDEAQSWLDAVKTYPEGANQIYLDSLIEMGWIQSLGG